MQLEVVKQYVDTGDDNLQLCIYLLGRSIEQVGD